MTGARTAESISRECHAARGLLTAGATLLGVSVLSGPLSYLLDCNSPGFFLCGPMSLLDFQLRDALALAGVLSVSLSFELRFLSRRPPERSVQVRPESSNGTEPHRRDPVRPLTLAISVVVPVVLCVGLALIPAPQPFVMSGVAIYDLEAGCGGIDTQAGSAVSFQWNAPSNVTFLVLSCATGWYTWESGSSGAGSFVSSGGFYEFGASCPGSVPCVAANVEGRYVGPIMPLI
jgi:hypothetical protein